MSRFDEQAVSGAHVALALRRESESWSQDASVTVRGVTIGWSAYFYQHGEKDWIPTGIGHTWAKVGEAEEAGYRITRQRTLEQRVAEYAGRMLAKADGKRLREAGRREEREAGGDDGGLGEHLARDPFAEEE